MVFTCGFLILVSREALPPIPDRLGVGLVRRLIRAPHLLSSKALVVDFKLPYQAWTRCCTGDEPKPCGLPLHISSLSDRGQGRYQQLSAARSYLFGLLGNRNGVLIARPSRYGEAAAVAQERDVPCSKLFSFHRHHFSWESFLSSPTSTFRPSTPSICHSAKETDNKMLSTVVSLLALSSVAICHDDHSQTPVSGPHKSLWYNTIPGDGGTQVGPLTAITIDF